MRLVVTGGGTGGHIYPALEVAKAARDAGHDVTFWGSVRGPEGNAAQSQGFPFTGFDAWPLVSLRTSQGWIALVKLWSSSIHAKRALKEAGFDAMFATGGYGAAPGLFAARRCRVPFVIHESNSIPGRTNRLFGARSAGFTFVFRTTESHIRAGKSHRTGQPIRKELRDAVRSREESLPLVLVLGGSQGSQFLNDQVPKALADMPEVNVLHATGRALFERLASTSLPKSYRIVPYLETEALALAYRTATVAIGRSGGTLAEFAMARLPSILVPLPHSADQHQQHNAREFERMEAATSMDQSICSPSLLRETSLKWLSERDRRSAAAQSLAEWDIPDATERILTLVEATCSSANS